MFMNSAGLFSLYYYKLVKVQLPLLFILNTYKSPSPSPFSLSAFHIILWSHTCTHDGAIRSATICTTLLDQTEMAYPLMIYQPMKKPAQNTQKMCYILAKMKLELIVSLQKLLQHTAIWNQWYRNVYVLLWKQGSTEWENHYITRIHGDGRSLIAGEICSGLLLWHSQKYVLF